VRLSASGRTQRQKGVRPGGNEPDTVTRLNGGITRGIPWFNHRRLHAEIGHVPPVEYESAYWSTQMVASYRENPVPAVAGTKQPSRFSQGRTDRIDSVFVTGSCDDQHDQRWAVDLRPNKADACFAIVLARRSSRFSRSCCAIRSASPVVVPERNPPSISA